MRGLFSTGIADVLLEEGITVDGMVGVSAGACLCCNYKSRQVGRALRYNVLLRNDPKYMSVRNLIMRKYPKVVVAEQNMGQLAGYLRMKVEGVCLHQFNQVKGQPFVVQELVDAFTKIMEESL